MRGGYVLLIYIPSKTSLRIKSLGSISIDSGHWVYIGSAMGLGSTSLENRISRHFRSKKKVHWHIDYLLSSKTKLKSAIWASSQNPIECELVTKLEANSNFRAGPKGFGASDCKKKCISHLYQVLNEENIEDVISDIFRELKLKPKITYDGKITGCS